MPGRSDWNPEAYAQFGDLRLRPALDLLAQVRDLPAGDIVDLGCGSGAAGAALAARFGDRRRIHGVDASPAMLKAARGAGCYDRLIEVDAAVWSPETPPALIFSNAALHWLPGHDALMPRLAACLAPRGMLAVQMPRQYGAPSHRFLRDFAAEMFPDRFDLASWKAPVGPPVEYHRMLSELGRVDVWETDYVQRLDPAPEGHPVRRFTQATAMRPYLEALSATEAENFIRRYDQGLAAAYPVESDGSVLFPFRRLFFTLTR
ncbi:methyltransferase domain-containing protein [Defluviimonas salinarum]|uniref:Methyltransferase domain-containing protein n=1 Tax=Defluviimonas salinarum TaxID=2992147 RepID=A0ABT3J8E6_9RHOB|nr:methyltransferase domain-containing protein [Defluviimonas salinarum]MCW3783930.1 methyltransferase domain-containing protein [Defluviimonas salinarum]